MVSSTYSSRSGQSVDSLRQQQYQQDGIDETNVSEPNSEIDEKDIQDHFKTVKSCIRTRAMTEEEKRTASQIIIEPLPDKNQLIAYHPESREGLLYNFDFVFDENTAQDTIFECVGIPAVNAVLEGYNASIIAYGPSKTGKSQLLYGNDTEVGLVSMMMREAFSFISDCPDEIVYTVTCSFWEMSNHDVFDLLNPDGTEVQRKVRHHPQMGVYITNLTEIQVTGWDMLEQYVSSALVVSQKMAAARGIRWHSFLKFNIYREDENHPELTIKSTMLFACLKGSERYGKQGIKGQTLKHGSHINQSLCALGTAIHNVVTHTTKKLKEASDEGQAKKKLHKEVFSLFGDSKLTAILSEALGGNYCTCILGNISSVENHYLDTMDTLENLRMANHIPTYPQRGVIETEVNKLFKEIQTYIRKMPEDPLHKDHPLTEEQEQLQKMKANFARLIEGHSIEMIQQDEEIHEQQKLKEIEPMDLPEGQLWKKHEAKARQHGFRHTFYVPDKKGNIKSTFKGQWENGEKSGEGEYSNDKEKYKGGWARGKKHGVGTLWIKTEDGKSWRRIYHGEWQNDMKHGHGVCFYKNGEIYEGEWKENKRHGPGSMYHKDGTKQEGEFADDKANGFNNVLEKNGNRFEGYFKNGLKHGPGTYYYFKEKQVLEGEWFEGICKRGELRDIDPRTAVMPPMPKLELLNPNAVL